MAAATPSIIDEEYNINPAQIASFKNNGHILLKNVISNKEINDYNPYFRDALRSLFDTTEQPDISEAGNNYDSFFTRITNLWQKSLEIKRFVFARKFARIASELLQVECVRLYNDQGLFKEPGGLATPWQQNLHFLPLDTEDVITMWIPIAELSEEMGSVTFASSSHKLGYLGSREDSVDTNDHYEEIIKKAELNKVSYTVDTGDALFFYGWTLYSSDANNGNKLREALAVTFYPDGTEILEPDNSFRRQHLRLFFPDKKPGDLAEGEFNPVLFSRQIKKTD